MTERSIERQITNWCNKQGWHCLKLTAQEVVGFPDRTVIKPDGTTCFLEIKRNQGSPSHHQLQWRDRLNKMGFTAAIVYSLEEAKEVLGETS